VQGQQWPTSNMAITMPVLGFDWDLPSSSGLQPRSKVQEARVYPEPPWLCRLDLKYQRLDLQDLCRGQA
jgi:hypothetical protein